MNCGGEQSWGSFCPGTILAKEYDLRLVEKVGPALVDLCIEGLFFLEHVSPGKAVCFLLDEAFFFF